MKNLFKKFYKPAEADNKEEAEHMATKEGQPVMAADNKVAEMAALLESATTTLASTQKQLAELATQYAVAQSALQSAEDAKAALVADAAQKRMSARKESIVASVGTAKADALLAATDNLDDASFNAVVSAMSGTYEAEAKTAMFKEVGMAAKTDPSAVAEMSEPEESAEAKMLKAKYQKSK